eukprot:GHVU01142082.1.p1 GENE.GHVU01142082.1~~GHVU01142082.1.p1  ORF type:complete len:115 (-),score=7.40 GHVU01142082.1:254-598(-)
MVCMCVCMRVCIDDDNDNDSMLHISDAACGGAWMNSWCEEFGRSFLAHSFAISAAADCCYCPFSSGQSSSPWFTLTRHDGVVLYSLGWCFAASIRTASLLQSFHNILSLSSRGA